MPVENMTQKLTFKAPVSYWGVQGEITGISVILHTLLTEDSQYTQPCISKTKRPLIPVAMATLDVTDSGESKCQETQSSQHAEPKL
jgi:hypothetical protein